LGTPIQPYIPIPSHPSIEQRPLILSHPPFRRHFPMLSRPTIQPHSTILSQTLIQRHSPFLSYTLIRPHAWVSSLTAATPVPRLKVHRAPIMPPFIRNTPHFAKRLHPLKKHIGVYLISKNALPKSRPWILRKIKKAQDADSLRRASPQGRANRIVLRFFCGLPRWIWQSILLRAKKSVLRLVTAASRPAAESAGTSYPNNCREKYGRGEPRAAKANSDVRRAAVIYPPAFPKTLPPQAPSCRRARFPRPTR